MSSHSEDSGLIFVAAAISTFESHKELADRAVAQLPDEKLHAALDRHTNSIAVIMKHVSGNLRSRWTDVFTTDGEKPWRDRDDEFRDTFRDRAEVVACWESGWSCLFDVIHHLTADDLSRTVIIRGVSHSVPLAMQRSLGHTCYHVGQIVQVARILAEDNWKTLTIPRGGSAEFNRDHWGPIGRSPNA